MAENSRILVRGPAGAQVIEGELQPLPGISPKAVYEKALQAEDPFQDVFVFESGGGAYLFTAPSDRFSLDGKEEKEFAIELPLRKAAFAHLIDRAGEVSIADVRMEIAQPAGWEGADSHASYLVETVVPYLKKVLGEKPVSYQTFQENFGQLLPLLSSLSLQTATRFEKMADGRYRLDLKAVPAPLALDISVLPEEIRSRIKKMMNQKMEEYLAAHPLVRGLLRLDMDFGEEPKKEYKPVAHRSDTILSWKYPGYFPKDDEALLRQIVGGVFNLPAPELILPIMPGERIPIPQHLLQAMDGEIQKWAKDQPGRILTPIVAAAQPGHYRMQLEKGPQKNIGFAPEQMAQLKGLTGIDLSEEASMVQGGTGNWSQRQLQEWIGRVEKKYRDRGFQFLSNHPQALVSLGNNLHVLNLTVVERLIGQEDFLIQGEDLKLPGMLSESAVRDVMVGGRKNISQEEIFENYRALRDQLRERDYLATGAYPNISESGFPLVRVIENGKKVAMEIKVARCGALEVHGGDLPEASRAALIEALQWRENEPFHPKEFSKRLSRALAQLQLRLEGGVGYAYQNLTELNVVLKLKKPHGEWWAGAGVGESGRFVASANVGAPHAVEGTSHLSAQTQIGLTAQMVGVNAESLPFTRGGTRVEGGLNVGRDENPAAGVSYRNAGGHVMMMIPLGEEGVASPLHLLVPVRVRYSRSEGRKFEEHLITGSGLGLRYLDGEVLGSGDLLELSVTQNVDRDAVEGNLDTTTMAHGSYQMPLPLGDLQLEVNGDFYHRRLLQGERLPLFRWAPGQTSPLDFARGMVPTSYDTNATASAVVRQPLGPVSLFAGASASAGRELRRPDSLENETVSRAAVGVGIDVLPLGLRFYLGWEVMENGAWHSPSGSPRFGIGMAKRFAID